jgi:hypothetical protein
MNVTQTVSRRNPRPASPMPSRSRRASREPKALAHDEEEFLYLEVTEYEKPDAAHDSAASATASDASSSVGTDSTLPLPVDEQALCDDEPCAIWPSLEALVVGDAKGRSCSIDSTCSALSIELSLEESAASLLETMSPHMSPGKKLESPSVFSLDCEGGDHRRSSDHLSMSQLLARRLAAAAVLTSGCARVGGLEPLPLLPDVVARLVLEEALPLTPALTAFVNVTNLRVEDATRADALDLRSCGLTADTAGVVAWLMRHNPRLTRVDVSGNELGSHGALAIVNAVATAPALAHLALDHIGLCSSGGTDPSALVALSRELQTHGSLRTLSLRGNAIGKAGLAGVRELCGAISCPSCRLTSLDLGHNHLQSAGLAVLAAALLQTPSLSSLGLAANALTGQYGKAREGMRALGIALALNTTLVSLDLSSNSLGGPSSESMELWHHGTRCSARHLVTALERNSTLQGLQLEGNHLVGRQGDELRGAWARHPRGAPLAF